MIRIKGVTIHPTGLLLIGFVIYCCFEQNSVMPLIWLSLALGIGFPACYYIHKWNEQENAKMAEEFPNDPYYKKYHKK